MFFVHCHNFKCIQKEKRGVFIATSSFIMSFNHDRNKGYPPLSNSCYYFTFILPQIQPTILYLPLPFGRRMSGIAIPRMTKHIARFGTWRCHPCSTGFCEHHSAVIRCLHAKQLRCTPCYHRDCDDSNLKHRKSYDGKLKTDCDVSGYIPRLFPGYSRTRVTLNMCSSSS